MKQLLFLLLFPCLAMAQYQGNGNQKITLGEQTTADGLVYRGLAADTTRKPSVDTMAFILLDTNTNIIWQYKKATNNAWTRVGGSISSGVTGVLPVANGGTNTSTSFTAGSVVFAGASGTYTQDNSGLFFDETNNRLGVGKSTLNAILNIEGNITASGNQGLELTRTGVSRDSARFSITNATNGAGIFLPTFSVISNYKSSTLAIGGIFAASPQEDDSSDDVAWRIVGNRKNNTIMTTGAIAEFSTINNIKMRIMANGNVGIGQTTPTAILHLKAGTATASTAPLKFTSGTNLTTAEAGAMEFNGTNLFFSPSTTRHTVNHGLTGSATLNFPSTTTLLSADLTITVTGAADGDVVSLGVPNAAVNANTSYSAWVSAANTVTVRFNNYSSGTVDPASGTFKVFVTK